MRTGPYIKKSTIKEKTSLKKTKGRMMWTAGGIKEGDRNSNEKLLVRDWSQREAANFREIYFNLWLSYSTFLPSLCVLPAHCWCPFCHHHCSLIYRQYPEMRFCSRGRAPVLFAFLCTCSITQEAQQATAHLTVHCLGTHQPKTQHYFWGILKVYTQQGDAEVIAKVIAVQAYIVPGGC